MSVNASCLFSCPSARLLALQARGLDDQEAKLEMDAGASDAALTQRKSAPAAVQRAPKRKRAEMSASPSNDTGGHGTRGASQRRRLSAPTGRGAAQTASRADKAFQDALREREAIKRKMGRNNARVLREAAAKRAAACDPPAMERVADGARSSPAASLGAGPQGHNSSAAPPQSPDVAGPQSPDVAGPIQVNAVSPPRV